jgi:hypothetical protein
MPVSKDFRVKKGLIVGENVDATSGNVSAINVDASGTFSAGTFEPENVTATVSVSSPSISADNIWGNIKDVTYSDLTLSGTTSATSLSAESLSAVNIYGNIKDVTYSDLTIAGTTSASNIMLDSGSAATTSNEWSTGGVTLQSSYANIGDGSTGVLFTVPMAKYRSGKCLVQAVAMGTGNVGIGTTGGSSASQNQEVTELLFIHNGTEVNMIEYASVGIGSTVISQYTAAINGANVEIRALAMSPSDTFVQFIGTITQLHTTQV